MRKLIKPLLMALALTSLISVSSCSGGKTPEPDPTPTPTPAEPTCTVDVSTILVGTPYETSVYSFTSDVEGPTCCIVGGIHGDEVAGWKAANKLIKRTNFKGRVVIIPNANILADTLVQRYAGYGNDGVVTSTQITKLSKDEVFKNRDLDEIKDAKYADLNRSFPGTDKNTTTKKIANALYNYVIELNPDYLVDLHESLKDHTYIKSSSSEATYLGNLIIYGNAPSSEVAWDMCDVFNEEYLEAGEVEFEYYEGLVQGSFCNTLGKVLPNSKVFTFETTRTYQEERRIEQQLQLCEIFLETAYSDYIG